MKKWKAIPRTAYIVGGDAGVRKLFRTEYGFDISTSPEAASLLVFTGGADVDPLYYGETQLDCTVSNPKRDKEECDLYRTYKNKLKFGICRGAQFLHVLNGGRMWQDCDNHALTGTHRIFDIRTKAAIEVTSTHHQMMFIPTTMIKNQAEVIAVARRSTYKRNEELTQFKDKLILNENWGDDLEVVMYKNSASLCFQPHPEYNSGSTAKYAQTLINLHLFNR